jgi:hypothetical protein
VLSRIILSLALLFNFKFSQIRQTRVSSWSPVVIQSYDPTTREGFEFSLPDDLEIETISGKGNWLVGKLRQSKDNSWAMGTLEDALGVAIEKPNQFVWNMATVGVAWKKKDIAQYLEIHTSADGIEVKKLNSKWDRVAKDWFLSSKLVSQKPVLKIENTVNYPGLGSHAARILESSGIKVGLIVSSDQSLGKCEVTGQGLVAEYTAHKFNCLTKGGNELVLKLGKDYLDYWKGR